MKRKRNHHSYKKVARWLLIALLPLVALGCVETQEKVQRAVADVVYGPMDDRSPMPEFTGNYKKIARDFYKIVFTEDGYPAEQQADSLIDHPMLGAYVINHYLARYKRGEDTLQPYIHKVAKASMKRMTPSKGALWLEYPKYLASSKVSGLTQSRYLIQFANLYAEFGDSTYRSVALKLFNSFLVSVDSGGFLNEFEHGVTLEEYPGHPKTYVLNGWLTALWNLHIYSEVMEDGRADSLFRLSAETVAHLLPLYDYPEQYNSLYQLAGYQPMRMVFEEGEGVIYSLTVDWPGLESYQIVQTCGNRYKEKYLPCMYDRDVTVAATGYEIDDERVHLNILTNILVEPEVMTLTAVIESKQDDQVHLEYAQGRHVPTQNFITKDEWVSGPAVTLREGLDTVVFDLDNALLRGSYPPTKFGKKVEGKYYNAYHYIHIDKLRKLYEVSGLEPFKVWADKWADYTKKWPDLEILQGEDIATEPL